MIRESRNLYQRSRLQCDQPDVVPAAVFYSWHTHEEIICLRYIATDAEELHEIVELTMDVAAYLQVL